MLAADSWLVDTGRVRGWERHWSRFRSSATAAGAAEQAIDELRAELLDGLPREGRWFPRVECDGKCALSWRLRPAPERRPDVACLRDPVLDPRASPRTKGPDLDALVALRASVSAAGAGEVLLCDGDGRLLEGALSCLLWWSGDTLCVVDETLPILAGVTRGLVLDIAAEQGVPVERLRPTLSDLDGCEVWLTSALHGIRAVTAWAPDGPPGAPTTRAAEWQGRLEGLAVDIGQKQH